MNRNSTSDIILLSGNSHLELANQIARHLHVRLAICSVIQAANSETLVDIGQSLRGNDVHIIQTGTETVNNDVMELLILANTCKMSSCRKVVGVIPYLPYSKQTRLTKRSCVTAKLLARMMEKAGYTQVITVDLQQKEVQGFFDIPVDNLRALPFLLKYIKEKIPDYQNAVIVAKDPNSVGKATSFAKKLRLHLAVIYGGNHESETDAIGGRGITARMIQVGLRNEPVSKIKEKRPLYIVGDVEGKDAILVANMIDDAEPFVTAAETLMDKGACKIYVVATHGLFSLNAPLIIEKSCIYKVIVANTIPNEMARKQCSKIKTVDISILLSEAIRRIHNKESNFLFVPQFYFGR